MLIKGNTKLGDEIYCFSIPSGKTCPGKTKACSEVCYASKGFYHMSNVQESLQDNWKATKRASFVSKMVAEIRGRHIQLVRIHVAGDFYNAAYVNKWVEIAKQCPDTVFYAYTRSWRIVDMQEPLKQLAALKNTRMWLSCDKDTHSINGKPKMGNKFRICYMQLADDEPVPQYVHLVLRDDTKGRKLYAYGKQVCPAENGMKYPETYGKMTCSKCRLCIRTQPMPVAPELRLNDRSVRSVANNRANCAGCSSGCVVKRVKSKAKATQTGSGAKPRNKKVSAGNSCTGSCTGCRCMGSCVD